MLNLEERKCSIFLVIFILQHMQPFTLSVQLLFISQNVQYNNWCTKSLSKFILSILISLFFWFCCHWICLSGLVIVVSVYSFQIWSFQTVLLKNQKLNFVPSQQSWLLRFCQFILWVVTPLQWAGKLCIWQLDSLCHSWDQMVWAECWRRTPPTHPWYLQI